MNLTPVQQDSIRTILRANGAVVGYLFGSYVRGTAGILSDLDVGVIFPSSLSLEVQESKVEVIRSALEKTYGRDKVDVINIGTLKSPLLRYIIVLGEGVELYVDDISVRNQAARQALRSFEDTRHLRNIQSTAIRHIFA
jgi:predicted nucleotidyltransferase